MAKKKKSEQKPKRQLIVNCEKLETRVAMINEGRLEEYRIERKQQGVQAGSIYLGRIQNHEPSLQAAFVDIGAERNAFLHHWDMLPAAQHLLEQEEKNGSQKAQKSSGVFARLRERFMKEAEQEEDTTNDSKPVSSGERNIATEEIPKLFPKGSQILVQISKGPIGTKGARATTNISIPGRYLVLLPYSSGTSISKRIEERRERDRLKGILKEIEMPPGTGFICRTNAEGARSTYFRRDADMLLNGWREMADKEKKVRAPSLLYKEPDLVERTLRDFLTEDIDEIIIDEPETYRHAREFVSRLVSRSMAAKISIYSKARPIFEHYQIDRELMHVYDREVQLPGGGYICVDETEALIAIDINTGSSRKGKDQPETILKTNLEAADEIARQLRLRDVGGLVIVDFIDMRPAKHRTEVLNRMRKLAKDDRARSRILPISRLGLMEMTRQREQESLQDKVFDPCPYCHGRGRVKSSVSMSVEIQRRLGEVLQRNQHEKDLSIRVVMHPVIMARLKNEDAQLLDSLEEKYGQQLTFRADDRLHFEEFKIIDAETGVEF